MNSPEALERELAATAPENFPHDLLRTVPVAFLSKNGYRLAIMFFVVHYVMFAGYLVYFSLPGPWMVGGHAEAVHFFYTRGIEGVEEPPPGEQTQDGFRPVERRSLLSSDAVEDSSSHSTDVVDSTTTSSHDGGTSAASVFHGLEKQRAYDHYHPFSAGFWNVDKDSMRVTIPEPGSTTMEKTARRQIHLFHVLHFLLWGSVLLEILFVFMLLLIVKKQNNSAGNVSVLPPAWDRVAFVFGIVGRCTTIGDVLCLFRIFVEDSAFMPLFVVVAVAAGVFLFLQVVLLQLRGLCGFLSEADRCDLDKPDQCLPIDRLFGGGLMSTSGRRPCLLLLLLPRKCWQGVSSLGFKLRKLFIQGLRTATRTSSSSTTTARATRSNSSGAANLSSAERQTQQLLPLRNFADPELGGGEAAASNEMADAEVDGAFSPASSSSSSPSPHRAPRAAATPDRTGSGGIIASSSTTPEQPGTASQWSGTTTQAAAGATARSPRTSGATFEEDTGDSSRLPSLVSDDDNPLVNFLLATNNTVVLRHVLRAQKCCAVALGMQLNFVYATLLRHFLPYAGTEDLEFQFVVLNFTRCLSQDVGLSLCKGFYLLDFEFDVFVLFCLMMNLLTISSGLLLSQSDRMLHHPEIEILEEESSLAPCRWPCW
ncbi:unnamed protein product, partial [Amoebophrya sp. A120]|eukprot:GSA120T00024910001.1